MPTCCIVGCGNRGNRNKNVSLHRLPKKDDKRKMWLDSIGEKNLMTHTKNLFICSLHFEESCFIHLKRSSRLQDNAVPSIPSWNLPKQSQLASIKTIGTSQKDKDCTPSQVEIRKDGNPAQRKLLTQVQKSDIENRKLNMKLNKIKKQNKSLNQIINWYKRKIVSLQKITGNDQLVFSETIEASEHEEDGTSSEHEEDCTSSEHEEDCTSSVHEEDCTPLEIPLQAKIRMDEGTIEETTKSLLAHKLQSDIRNQALNLRLKGLENTNKSLKRIAKRHKKELVSLQEIIIENRRNMIQNVECGATQDILRRQIRKMQIDKERCTEKPFSKKFSKEKHITGVGTTKVNLFEPQPCAVAEDDHDAGDIQSDDDDGGKETDGHQFSWQKSAQICIEDDDDIFGEVPQVPTLDIEVEQAEKKPKDTSSEDHKEYFCDSCANSIVGFRYRCVECDNYDLCARCEAQARHDAHYMLRVPRPRPFSEIQSILEAIREKIKEFSEELQQNSLELEEIKQEPDFVDPGAVDPLSPRHTVIADTDIADTDIADITQCLSPPPPSPPHPETKRRKITAADNVTHSKPESGAKKTEKPQPTVTTYKAPRLASVATPDRPIYVISEDSSQKRPKVTQLTTGIFKPQTASAVMDPIVKLKQLDSVNDEEKPHEDGKTSKRTLTAFIEKSFKRDQIFKDMAETFKYCVENIQDGNTSGKGLKRKNSDIEETWLDEELLDEDIYSSPESEEDCEESPSARVTRSATKMKQLSEENAPDT